MLCDFFFFFKQKTAYEMRISDWSSDVCSSDLSRLGYEVVINSDEEVGSPSSARLIEQAAQGKIAALTYEPALPDGTLAGARAGSGNFSVLVIGKSAHAGRNPEEGRNAIVAARSEEHTSELQSLMRISYAVFCLKKK